MIEIILEFIVDIVLFGTGALLVNVLTLGRFKPTKKDVSYLFIFLMSAIGFCFWLLVIYFIAQY